MTRERIAILVGGSSREAEVSRRSGNAVAEALTKAPLEVRVFEVDSGLTAALEGFKPAVVMPIMHGPQGEDGTIQGYLEILGYPYTGGGVEASASALNKIIAKQLFRIAGLPVVPDLIFNRHDLAGGTGDMSALRQSLQAKLGENLVVKPACQGSALGVIFSRTEDIESAITEALNYGDRLLIEKRIAGRELTVGILESSDSDTLQAFPVTEILTPKDSWYDFKHRYDPKLSEHIIPADIPKQMAARIVEIACSAHRALGLRDYSRADFLLAESGDVYLLEVNNIPGMTPTSLYPDAARVAGLSLETLALRWIANVKSRSGPK